jgi:HlyD family secretion protein
VNLVSVIVSPSVHFRRLLFGTWIFLLMVFTTFAISAADTNQSAVACLGRIMPENGIINLAAPYTIQGPSLIANLMVTEGSVVTNGQLLAVTHYHEPLEAAYRLETARVKVAEARLAQVQAGQKPADIAAQKAAVQRLTAELSSQEKTFKREDALHKGGTLSDEEADRSQLQLDAAKFLLEENQQKLGSISEIRDVDVAYAKADLEVAIASANRAKAEWEQTYVRSPLDGTVLKIHAWPGTLIGSSGIMELARTDSMFVHAEVYETDIPKIKKGQHVEISGPILSMPLQGEVTHVGVKVGKNEVLNTDPTAYTDNRIVEVKIRLKDSAAAAPFINAQVRVRIFSK